MRKLLTAFLFVALLGCDARVSVMTKGDETTGIKPPEAIPDLTYKTVCLQGTPYYLSLVKTFDGQLGFRHDNWVIGGPVYSRGFAAPQPC